MTFNISRIKTGVTGLDNMIEGGVPFPATILVAGSAGTGKTTFGLQFLTQGAMEGEKGIYFATLSEPIQWLLRFTQDFEFMKPEFFGEEIIYVDMGALLKKTKDFTKVLKVVEENIIEHMPQRIVIDPITVLTKWKGYREFLFDMSITLKNWETTTLLTGECEPNKPYPVEVSYVVDGVILLSTRIGKEGSRQKFLEVMKMRGTQHITGMHMTNITSNGLQVQMGMGAGGMGTRTI
jgi:circadian clock protein KaiC